MSQRIFPSNYSSAFPGHGLFSPGITALRVVFIACFAIPATRYRDPKKRKIWRMRLLGSKHDLLGVLLGAISMGF